MVQSRKPFKSGSNGKVTGSDIKKKPTRKPAASMTAVASSTRDADAVASIPGGSHQLSTGEVNILAVFRKYLMTPGRMLCLNNTDIGTMKRSLEKLIAAGLLIPEDFKGSYSLTRSGFNAMNELN